MHIRFVVVFYTHTISKRRGEDCVALSKASVCLLKQTNLYSCDLGLFFPPQKLKHTNGESIRASRKTELSQLHEKNPENSSRESAILYKCIQPAHHMYAQYLKNSYRWKNNSNLQQL